MPIVGERADPVPAPTLSGLPHDVQIDRRPIPALGMIVLKIYAFGGLAFLVGTVLAGISWWIWVVIIKREYADSPPWLDLNPERMRAREVARTARLRARKEEKRMERERRVDEKFSPPPLELVKRDNRNRSSSAPISSATTATSALSTKVPIVKDCGGTTPTRPKSSSVSISSTLRNESSAARPKSSSLSTLVKPTLLNADTKHTPRNSTARPRKSSFSTGAKSPDKRVSWASSTATLDVNGCVDEMPISGKSAEPRPRAVSFVENPTAAMNSAEQTDQQEQTSRKPTLMPIPSHEDLLRKMPTARTSSPRISAALDPHARRGPDMVAVTTPDVASSWARELDSHDENGYCRCWISVDPLDRTRCDVHAPR